MYWPSGDQSTLETSPPEIALAERRLVKELEFQIRTKPSSAPVTTCVPSGEKSTS